MKYFHEVDREGSIEPIEAVVVAHDAESQARFEETAVEREEVGDARDDRRWPSRPALPTENHRRRGCRRRRRRAGKVRDKGFKDQDLKAIGENLPPGPIGGRGRPRNRGVTQG